MLVLFISIVYGKIHSPDEDGWYRIKNKVATDSFGAVLIANSE